MRDDRTKEQKAATICYVNATDSFLSGWGLSPNKSYYCVACPSYFVAQDVENHMSDREDFKRVAISNRPRKGGSGCDTAIVWYESFIGEIWAPTATPSMS